tara:strand:- start:11823 stop:12593 length:771 start_codon:yes stop_codon:yes gene_type:complete
MKIATWNVNSLRVRLEQVTAWLEQHQPDVLGLQETKMTDEHFPLSAFEEIGYTAVFSGQPTYNGVALISRKPPQDVVMEVEGFDDPQKRVLGATYSGIRIFNLYVPNGQSIDSDKYKYKLQWLNALEAQLNKETDNHELLLAMGDFNIAPDDIDVHDPAAWEGKILCSPKERTALTKIQSIGLKDTFRLFEQKENSFSWWDYRAAAFRRNMGMRIDLILASKKLSSLCMKCFIDIEPRKNERPSDHTPVIAEFKNL